MAVILLPLLLPATAWTPQRLTYAPIPKRVTPSAGDEPRPELDYWELTESVDRALRFQFRMPAGYVAAVDPIFTFDWFTPGDGETDEPLCKIGQNACNASVFPHGAALAEMGVGTLTTITGMIETDTANDIIRDSVTLAGANWTAGYFSTIVFFRNGTGADTLTQPVNFIGGDLLIAVTKKMG